MGILANSVTVLANTLLQTDGETVTYSRAADSASLTMVRGETELDEYSIDEFEFTGKTVDWLIEPADLTLPVAGTVLPAIGDLITDANAKSHKVVQLGGERQYRYTDQTQKFLRIHTIQVS